MKSSLKKYFLLIFLVIFAAVILLLTSCSEQPRTRIALSKGAGSEAYVQYVKWLKSINKNIECVDLYHTTLDSALMLLAGCDGLVLTGGPDVFPGRYNRLSDTSICEIDARRDTLEFALIKKAMKMKMPILAVCRGEQIINVAFDGSLYADIPKYHATKAIHRCEVPEQCKHKVSVDVHSELFKIVGVQSEIVNSNHHQAVRKVADDFRAVAFAEDSLIEAIEWKHPEAHQFLVAVQWHPERLTGSHPLSYPIGKAFIEKAKDYNIEKKSLQHSH